MRSKINADDLVFIGIKGTVVALDGATGNEVWRQKLRWIEFTNLTRVEDRLLVGVRGEIYCLDAATGSVLWHNPLKGLGFGLMTIAGAAQAPPAAARMRAEQAAAGSAVAVTR